MVDNPDKRIALLIDADNAPAGKIDVVLAEVARYGVANVRRAYGNWKSPHLKSWEAALHEYAIRPIQQFAYSSGKNASDMAMVIDAMDLLYARNLDGFAIVSSDADFTPLVMRLLTDGMKVYGFGEKKTPAPFVNACSKFTYVEALGEQAAAASDTAAGRKDATALRGDTRLVQMLRNAIDSACEDDGWAHLGAVGKQVANQASFDPRNYGYRKLSDLVRAIGLFEIKQDEQALWVRDVPKGNRPKQPLLLRPPRRPRPNAGRVVHAVRRSQWWKNDRRTHGDRTRASGRWHHVVGRRNSSNVRKVLWCLEEAGVAYTSIEVGGAFGGNDTPAYRALNPNGLVPALQDGALVLWESNAIVRYLAARTHRRCTRTHRPRVRWATAGWTGPRRPLPACFVICSGACCGPRRPNGMPHGLPQRFNAAVSYSQLPTLRWHSSRICPATTSRWVTFHWAALSTRGSRFQSNGPSCRICTPGIKDCVRGRPTSVA